jgi:methionine synthase II (cobalamin-independent)
MRRDTPPFRADHVGSLLRPPDLLRAREDEAAGRMGAEGLREIEDQAIREVVARQREVGLQSVTDGEFRRRTWHEDFIGALEGVSRGDEVRRVRGTTQGGETVEYETRSFHIGGRVRLGPTIFGDSFRFLESAAGTATAKQTIPSPSMIVSNTGRERLPEDIYPDLEAFAADVAAAYAEELRRLAELGCTYLQFDDTTLAFVNDPRVRQVVTPADATEPIHLLNIRTMNRALAGRPPSLRVTVHACRGNFRSGWFSEGGYEYVAEAMFNELQVDGFFLEYDDARSGGFEPLRFVPAGKLVVLGLVSSKRPELESKDALKRRVEEASRFVPIEQLCLSPQCGFASTMEGNALTQDEQWAKLSLVAEVAAEIWG